MTTEQADQAEPTTAEPSEEQAPPSAPAPLTTLPPQIEADGTVREAQDGPPAPAPDAEADGDAEQEEEAPKSPLESALDKRQRAQKNEDVSYTHAEYSALQEHERAESNRRRDFEAQETKRQQQVARLAEAHDGATLVVEKVFGDLITEIAGEVDLTPSQKTALRAQVAPVMQTLKNISEQVITEPLLEARRERIRETLKGMGTELDADQSRGLGQLGMDELDNTIYQLGRLDGVKAGQAEAAGKDKVLVAKKDFDRWTKGEAAASRAEEGDSVPPDRTSTRKAAPGTITKAQIAAATPDQVAAWLSDPTTAEQVNRAVAV